MQVEKVTIRDLFQRTDFILAVNREAFIYHRVLTDLQNCQEAEDTESRWSFLEQPLMPRLTMVLPS